MIIRLCLAAFLISYCLTYFIRRYALHKSLIDMPNARSSHTLPTPRGGGLAIVSTFFICLFLLQMNGQINLYHREAIVVLLASVAIAGIGFCDDHQHIPARWRLLVHLSATAIALSFLPHLPTIAIFDWEVDLAAVSIFFYSLAIVWLLNLYNFMDGIDGIASTEFISVTINASILLLLKNQEDRVFPLLLLAAAVAGFLCWNWPSAKIFMGDVGSGFLGFILGIAAVITSIYTDLNIWSWLILLGIFITDATFTLIKRVLNNEVWYEAHSSHAYQHYARQFIHTFQQQGFDSQNARTKSHRYVNFEMLLINLFWLFPLAAVATSYMYWGFLITVIAYLPLIFIAYRLKAGTT